MLENTMKVTNKKKARCVGSYHGDALWSLSVAEHKDLVIDGTLGGSPPHQKFCLVLAKKSTSDCKCSNSKEVHNKAVQFRITSTSKVQMSDTLAIL